MCAVATRTVGSWLGHNPSYLLFTCFGEGPALATIASMIEGGSVRPVLDSVFSLEQTVAAFEASKAGRARGKIVVQVQADNAH